MRRSNTALIFWLFAVTLPAQVKNITIDKNIEIQTIDNFAASDCWSMQKIGAWSQSSKQRVADLLFSVDKGIGLSAWRFNIGAGINNTTIRHPWRTVETFEVAQGQYDWRRQAEERWFLQAAKERGVQQFIAFVNSPPARMTRNRFTNCTEGAGSTNLRDGYEQQFAVYLVDILKHFRDEWGIDFDYISPVNEPQWEWNYDANQEGNRAANSDIRTIATALYNELQNQGLSTQISLVESGNLQSWYQFNASMQSKYGKKYGNYLSELIDHAQLQGKIANHLGGHSYWSDRLSSQLEEDRQALLLKMFPYFSKGWKYWMTEYTVLDGPNGQGGHGRDLTMETALNVARIIHFDLTKLRASAWQWWTAVSPEDYKDGLIYTNFKNNPGSESIIESKILWALGNFSRFIRPGSVALKLSVATDKYGLMGSAYRNAEDNCIIAVFVNVSNAEKPVAVAVHGLGAQKKIIQWTPHITSDKSGDNLKQYPAFAGDASYTIPARSVVTFVGEIENNTGVQDKRSDFTFGLELHNNYPNPFHKKTTISYRVPSDERVRLQIINIKGKLVKILTDEMKYAGEYEKDWDCTNRNDQPVSSGLYICELLSGQVRKSQKMLLIQ